MIEYLGNDGDFMQKNDIICSEINEVRKSGLYSVASLDMFEIVQNLEVTDNLYSHLEYTNEMLFEYLEEICELGENSTVLHEFLRALRVGDIIDNQKLEEQNSFLIGLFSQISRETAIGKLIKFANDKKVLTIDDIFDVHHTLLCGTASEGISSIRTSNDKFVGKLVDDVRVIDYFPLDYTDVMDATFKIADLYNKRLVGNEFDNVFLQPFLIHGLLGGLQIFDDGNTRMGRIMQHSLIWQMINEKTEFNFDLPPIYATRSYYPVRCKYRNKIAGLVTDGSIKAWNDWFDFNLDRVEDSIYAGRENIKTLKLKMKYK